MRKKCFFQLIGQWFGIAFFLNLTACGYSFQATKNPLLEAHQVRSIYVAPFKNHSFKPGVDVVMHREVMKAIEANKRVRIVSNKEDADAILDGNVDDANYGPRGSTKAARLYPQNRFDKIIKEGNSIQDVANVYQASLSVSFTLVLYQRPDILAALELKQNKIAAAKEALTKKNTAGKSTARKKAEKFTSVELAEEEPMPEPTLLPEAPPVVLDSSESMLNRAMSDPMIREFQGEAVATTRATSIQGLKKNGNEKERGMAIWSSGFARGKPFPGNNRIGVFGTTSHLINESEFDRAVRDLARLLAGDVHESMLVMF